VFSSWIRILIDDMDILIILLVVLALVLVGFFFLRNSRSSHAPTIEPSALDTADAELEQIDLGSGDLDADGVLIDRGLDETAPVDDPIVEPEPEPEDEPATFRDRLGRARSAMAGYLGSVISRGDVNAETWEELEEALIRADVGVSATTEILDTVRERADADKVKDGAELIELVKAEMKTRLGGQDLTLAEGGDPSVWLFVGVNGVGKTTTIGKIATREVANGRKLVLAAGDTFRAAAAEQLTMWADRSGADVVRGAEGGDPSSVIFDAVEHAAAAGAEIVLADTAGRLHTKTNLMNELSKVRRVAEKGAGTVTETLLVIDATTGQNGLIQAREFTEAADLTGVVLTKLDGSAKGGIVVAVQTELGIPVKLVGLGEGAHDLIPFDANDFVDALFS
jgi:fused signal recognition particle receptor